MKHFLKFAFSKEQNERGVRRQNFMVFMAKTFLSLTVLMFSKLLLSSAGIIHCFVLET